MMNDAPRPDPFAPPGRIALMFMWVLGQLWSFIIWNVKDWK